MTDGQDTVSRRSVLRSSVVAAGAAAGGTVVAGAATGNKRGGRAQVDGEVDRNRPFTLQLSGGDQRPASCMSAESVVQTYLTYSIEYCDSDDDEDAEMYVIPDDAELDEDETYVIRSVRECRANDLRKVAFGPARTDC